MNKVLITRKSDQCEVFAAALSEMGIESASLPMIQTTAIDKVCFMHDYYDLCVLTSPTSVQYFQPYHDNIKAKKYIAVGSVTAKMMLELLGIEQDEITVPENFYMAEIANLLKGVNLVDTKVLAPGAKVRTTDMTAFFEEKGAEYDAPNTYETNGVEYAKGEIEDFIMANDIDIVTFFSPSAVDSFYKQVLLSDKNINKLKIFALGTTTMRPLDKLNLKAEMPESQTMESMAECIKKFIGGK